MSAASPALGRFTEWLTTFGDAWEQGSAEDLGRVFVVGATFQPTPFATLLRGRAQIVGWYEAELPRWPNASFSAQVLGAGDTYGVAHFRVASADRALDGVLVVALDDRGRCTSLRQWSHETGARRLD